MAKLYFETGNDIALINGAICKDNFFETEYNDILAISYMSDNTDCLPVMLKLVVEKNKVIPNARIILTDCGFGVYIINFKNRFLSEFSSPTPYLQQSVTHGNITHYLTAFRRGEYSLSVETANEIITLPTYDTLCELNCVCSAISSGALISIDAKCSDKKFVCLLHYDSDYQLIFSAICDDFRHHDNELILTDNLKDMLSRTVTRHLILDDGAYVEQSREFEYGKKQSCIDELLPYMFVESVFCRDFEMCRRLSTDKLALADLYTILGDFEDIFSHTQYTYKPFQLGLIYRVSDDLKQIKYFEFGIVDSLVASIICLN